MQRLARSLMYAGIVVVVAGMSKFHASRIADPPYDFTGSSRFGWAIAYVVFLALTAYGIGLPDIPRTLRSATVSAIGAAVAGAAGVSIVQLVVGDALLPRFVVFGSAIVLVPWYVVCASLARGGRARAEIRDRVLFVGLDADGELLQSELRRSPEHPASIVAVMSLDEARPTGDGRLPAVQMATATDVSVVVLDREAQTDATIVSQAAVLHEQGVRVRTLSLFYEDWLGKLPLSELERVSLLFDIGELHRTRYGRVQRLIDVSVATVALVPLAVLTPLILVGNLFFNRGRLLYHQPRVGKRGAVFEIYKFRTMRSSGEAGGTWTTEEDDRVTTLGRFLRMTHLDELPQAWNILRGDLSTVGPRPEQPHYVEELTDKLPFYDLRHLVRPGLTGWAQVKYHYGADAADALEKLQYEFYYLRHQSLALDARIIGRTIRSVFGGEGR